MACEFCRMDEDRIAGLYLGYVLDNLDPRGLGRVRVSIPALAEDGTGWAMPMGTMGGGRDRRGFWAVPENGSEVAVMFVQGDATVPVYWSGHWGIPDREEGDPETYLEGGNELPDTVKDAPIKDRPKIRVMEYDNFAIVIDDRGGQNAVVMTIKAKGDAVGADGSILDPADRAQTFIEIDKSSATITVHTEDRLLLEAASIRMNAAEITLNGRRVSLGSKPI